MSVVDNGPVLTRIVLARLDEQMYAALTKHAQDNDRNISQTIRHALRALLEATP